MRLLRASDYREMPWKNGGGTTTEIAVFPAGAGLDSFDWRISMARIGGSGPFSLFAGIDRTLTILDGDGMRLTIGGAVPVGLGAASDPLSFPADIETHAVLSGGPVTDLNVMTRRDRASHSVKRLAVRGTVEIPVADDLLLVFSERGTVSVIGPQPFHLGSRDTLVVEREAGQVRLQADEESVVLLIAIATGDRAR